MESVPEKPREELIIALAGPAVNIVIVLAMLPFVSVPDYDTENAALATIGSGNFLFALMVVNLWLALFNLIPAFPMDGGRVLRALLSFRLGHVKATRIAASFGQALAIGFVFLGFVYNPFLIFIGLFIFIGAQAEAVEVESKALLHGFTVKDVLMQQVPAIGHHLTIKDAARRLLDGQNKNFVVMDGSTPVGTLSRDEIIKGLQHYDPEMLVDKIKDGNLESLPEDMPLKEAWTKIRQQKKPLMLVFSSGQLQGVVDEENIAEFLLIRSAQRKNTLEQ